MRFCRSLLAAALICIALAASTTAAEPPAKDIKVSVKDNKLTLQNEKLTFPGELEPIIKVLGKPSRVVDGAAFRYQIWDDYGIAVKQNTSRKEKTTIGLQLNLKLTGSEEDAKKLFAGSLVVEGQPITASTDMAALGKPFEQFADFAIWEIPDQKASVLFKTDDKKGKGVKLFLYEQGSERR